MEKQTQAHIETPAHPVPHRYLEPILYLAERMVQSDRIEPIPEKRMVDELAKAVGYENIRRQPWYRSLDDKKACEQLDLATTKKAALVVMALVLKADTNRGDPAKEFFRKMRETMGADPVVVPGDLEEHKKLALRYLKD
jgi:hypothetical protein